MHVIMLLCHMSKIDFWERGRESKREGDAVIDKEKARDIKIGPSRNFETHGTSKIFWSSNVCYYY